MDEARRMKKIKSLAPLLLLGSLASCTANAPLATVSLDVSYDISFARAEDYEPSIHLFSNREELVDFLSISPYSLGDDFYSDLDQFEDDYGFDDHLLLHFGQILNDSELVDAYIEEGNDGESFIDFKRNSVTTDTHLTSESYYQAYYRIDKYHSGQQKLTFRIDGEVFRTDILDAE